MTTTTTNGMGALENTKNACVDLFFAIGASRGQDIIPKFKLAFNEDQDTAIRILLWTRDVRGGAGERKLFRDVLVWLAEQDVDLATKVAQKVPELGRFDDLFVLFGTDLEPIVVYILVRNLEAENGLCAKWCPRKGKNANILRKAMCLTPKEYRKLLVENTKVVEQQMCAKDWDNIDFSKVPSLASARYQKAFGKNATDSYVHYLEQLKKGETKINAGAVYPYDIVKSLSKGNSAIASEQWKALPNYMEGCNERILPVVDVSGSMSCTVGGTVTAMDVAISLGLYISERNVGAFKDRFITFSSNPQLQELSGSLAARYSTLQRADWGMSTDIEAVFRLVLSSAKMYQVPETQMPTKILILSDMQFNSAVRGGRDQTAIQMIADQYASAGYNIPEIVFWNLAAKSNVPVEFDKTGTALISGFSPAIMKSVLRCENVTPVDVMMDAISDERYAL